MGVAIFISNIIDLKIKTVPRDKEEHYIIIKGSIQEDITIINIHAPNRGTCQYTRQMLTTIKGEIDNNTIIVMDFDTPLTAKNRSFRQKINRETQTFNDTLEQRDVIHIYRAFHLKTVEFTFFSSAQGTFLRPDHIVGHRISLDKVFKN